MGLMYTEGRYTCLGRMAGQVHDVGMRLPSWDKTPHDRNYNKEEC